MSQERIMLSFFQKYLEEESSLVDGIVGFHDAIRKCEYCDGSICMYSGILIFLTSKGNEKWLKILNIFDRCPEELHLTIIRL